MSTTSPETPPIIPAMIPALLDFFVVVVAVLEFGEEDGVAPDNKILPE